MKKKIEFFTPVNHQTKLAGSIVLDGETLIAYGRGAKRILEGAMQSAPTGNIESIWTHVKRYALKRESPYWRVIVHEQ